MLKEWWTLNRERVEAVVTVVALAAVVLIAAIWMMNAGSVSQSGEGP